MTYRDPLSDEQTESIENRIQEWKDERMMSLMKHLDDYRIFKFVLTIADEEGHAKFQTEVERLERSNWMIHNVKTTPDGRPYYEADLGEEEE